MEDNKSMEVFAKAPIRKAVLQNALPAMAAMLMVLIRLYGVDLFTLPDYNISIALSIPARTIWRYSQLLWRDK